jgi:hypothetical protein
LDLDGNTKLKSNAGHSGNDSSIVSNAVQFADRKFQAENLNEFYKKGCQEKSSSSTGGREDFVSRSSPLHCQSASRFAREVLLLSCLPFL